MNSPGLGILAAVLWATWSVGCGSPPGEQPRARPPTPGCRAPAGVSSAPRSIDETVTLLNALPKPLSLPCFLESLDRPLEVHGTLSVFSAQPATGARSPRIFVFLDPNIFSIVPEGIGRHLLEFGEQREGHRSLKAEVSFPVLEQLAPELPYETALFDQRFTNCAFCHAEEVQDPAILHARAFASQALRPKDQDQVAVQLLKRELETCDPELMPERCAILDGLLGWGELSDRAFPSDMPTFSTD